MLIRQFEDLKMKYKLLSFIVGLMLTACTGKHDNAEQTNSATDSTSLNIRTGGLFDSIHDARLKQEVAKESIDLLSVKHVVVNGDAIEQILYIDQNANKTVKSNLSADPYPGLSALISDSVPFLLNPLREMNGKYTEVFSYKGKYMTASIGDLIYSDEIIVTDSAMIWIPSGFNFLLYKSGERIGDKVTYVVSDDKGQLDTIEVKQLKGELKMQLWKWRKQGEVKYSLRVSDDKIGYLPGIFAQNNVGLDGDMEVTFDKIDYDSLMTEK